MGLVWFALFLERWGLEGGCSGGAVGSLCVFTGRGGGTVAALGGVAGEESWWGREASSAPGFRTRAVTAALERRSILLRRTIHQVERSR